MAIFDKIKHILFDEEDVEIDVGENELPEREPKPAKIKAGQGFVDHHAVEEDTIAEVKLPKEEDEVKEEPVQPVMSRAQLYDYGNDFDDEIVEDIPKVEEVKPRQAEVYREERPVEVRREVERIPAREPIREIRRDEEFERIAREERLEAEKHEVKHNEPRDYKKLISSNENEGKKPFKVTPVISPVYGILDKNYKPEEVIIKTPEPTNNGPREFGPVSYNGDPLPEPIKYQRENVKEDIVSLSRDIDAFSTEDVPKLKEEPIESTSVEDEFDSTSEYNKIAEDDSLFSEFDTKEEVIEEPISSEEIEAAIDEEKEPTVDIASLIKSTDEFNAEPVEEEPEELEFTSEYENPVNTRDEEIDEDNNLDETIETDLFNLIDSMYKDDEKESE